jgi:hypothetical protein
MLAVEGDLAEAADPAAPVEEEVLAPTESLRK